MKGDDEADLRRVTAALNAARIENTGMKALSLTQKTTSRSGIPIA